MLFRNQRKIIMWSTWKFKTVRREREREKKITKQYRGRIFNEEQLEAFHEKE